MIVPFNQFLIFIVVGVKPFRMETFRDRELTFTFENYVKSQLHLQTVTEIYGRDINLYLNTLNYLRGQDKYLYECSQVLKYFYADMTNMMCNVLRSDYANRTKIEIKVDLPRNTQLPKKVVKLSEVVEELREVLEGRTDGKDFISTGIFTRFQYNELAKLEPSGLLALASIFQYYGNDSDQTYVVEVI